MIRHLYWEKLLNNKFQEWSAKKFIWGKSDCCIFAGDCIESMTNINPMKNFIYKYADSEYKTKKEAMSLIKNTFNDLPSCIEKVMGKPKNINFAKRGDLVLFASGKYPHICGIVDLTGSKIISLSMKDGLIKFPLSDGHLSWEI
tara:strand:+ start:156 stop:587 length:432 start_codon:yes stop_codon:yes gene_type:complete